MLEALQIQASRAAAILGDGRATPGLLVLVPAVSLTAFWLADVQGLLITAIAAPLALAALSLMARRQVARHGPVDRLTGALTGPAWKDMTLDHLIDAQTSGTPAAVLAISIDAFNTVRERHGNAAADRVMREAARRLRSTLREDDLLGHALPGAGDAPNADFMVYIAPQRMLDLEAALAIAGRLSGVMEDAFAIDGTRIYVSISIGISLLGRIQKADLAAEAARVIAGSRVALRSALAAGPGAIRAYSAAQENRGEGPVSNRMALDAAAALEDGQIIPWFQPQISTDTGKITGFEALARWIHPRRGVITPDEFLPVLEQAGLLPQLAERMIYHALTALRAWDQAGLEIPQVGLNFETGELSDPKLVERITWELDRFELTPDRLSVEILETVVARSPDDIICRNIAGLAALGCRIDLDDFGTGHASLASLRRFSISRIKIDRSFIAKADRDPEQQRMVGAILTMAEQLNLDTLAEGVETVGEHALLAQLGCAHVQGFGIGRPMPFDQTLSWIRTHEAKLTDTPQIGRSAGR